MALTFKADFGGTNQTGFVDNIDTLLTFDNASLNEGNHYDPLTGILTPPAGPVDLSAQAGLAAGASPVSIRILKNGTPIARSPLGGALLVVAKDTANGTDQYTVDVRGNSGSGNYSVNGNVNHTNFNGQMDF